MTQNRENPVNPGGLCRGLCRCFKRCFHRGVNRCSRFSPLARKGAVRRLATFSTGESSFSPLARKGAVPALSALSLPALVSAAPQETGEDFPLTVGIVTVILLVIAATIVVIALLPMKKHPEPPKPTGKTPGMGNNGKGFRNTTPTETGDNESSPDEKP